MLSTTITHLSGWSNYTRIHYSDGNVVIKAATMALLMAKPEYASFIRIHRRFAVNPPNIQYFIWDELKPTFFTHCFLRNVKGYLPVARRRAAEVRTQFLDFRKANPDHQDKKFDNLFKKSANAQA
jgi:DNA-binding LytR/AlgR family response regulator